MYLYEDVKPQLLTTEGLDTILRSDGGFNELHDSVGRMARERRGREMAKIEKAYDVEEAVMSGAKVREWWIVVPHDPGAVDAGALPDLYLALPPPQSSRDRAQRLAVDWERSCGGWGVRGGRRVRYSRVVGPYRTRDEARAAQRSNRHEFV